MCHNSRTLRNERKKGGPGGPPNRNSAKSEGEAPLELNQSWGSVATEERTQDAGWGVDRSNDRAKVRVGNIADRLVEVGVVE